MSEASDVVKEKYQIGNHIGNGYYGTVYEGMNKTTQEKIAIKIINKTMNEKNEEKSIIQKELMTKFKVL